MNHERPPAAWSTRVLLRNKKAVLLKCDNRRLLTGAACHPATTPAIRSAWRRRVRPFDDEAIQL